MNICALSQLDFTESGRRHTTPPPFPRVTLVGARYAISAEDAKANNKNKNNKAKEDKNIDKKKAKKDNRDKPKDGQ